MGDSILRVPHATRPYLIWSTVIDAPVTPGMTLKELRRWIREQHGLDGIREMPGRMARVAAKGTSSLNEDSVEDVIAINRAGARETQLTLEQIVQHYCEDRGQGDKPHGVEWPTADDYPDDYP